MLFNMGLSSRGVAAGTGGARIVALAFVLMGFTGFADAQSPDSLIRRSMVLGRQEQIGGHAEDAVRFFGQAEQLAQRYSLYAALCEARIKIGEVIYDRGNYDSAFTYFAEAEKLADAHGLSA